MLLFTTQHIFLTALIFIVGICFGSFLNVIVYRLPNRISLTRPPSSCPRCEKIINPADLIPVVGYFLLKGRCRHCNIKIGLRYPLVEFLTGVLFVIIYSYYGLTLEFFIYVTLLFLLFAIAQVDLKHRLVPNTLVAAGLIAGFLYYFPGILALFLPVPAALISERAFWDGFAGMLFGGGIMLVIFLVSRGGMGAGDIKLMVLIGLYIGLRGAAVVLLLGFIFGALTGIAFMATGKLTRKDALPFAPFLSLAAFLQVLWGDHIWLWYMDLW